MSAPSGATPATASSPWEGPAGAVGRCSSSTGMGTHAGAASTAPSPSVRPAGAAGRCSSDMGTHAGARRSVGSEGTAERGEEGAGGMFAALRTDVGATGPSPRAASCLSPARYATCGAVKRWAGGKASQNPVQGYVRLDVKYVRYDDDSLSPSSSPCFTLMWCTVMRMTTVIAPMIHIHERRREARAGRLPSRAPTEPADSAHLFS